MKTLKSELILIAFLLLFSCHANEPDKELPADEQTEKEFRDPLKQPFRSTSIWNMPIGKNAEYIPANIERAMARGMTIDEDIIVMKPNSPMLEIYTNNAGWNREKDRCIKEGPFLFSAPIPADFVVSQETWDGLTPNSGLAVLMPDKRTIKQTQPFARCEANKSAASKYIFSDNDIYGNGYYGAHGGSGLSAIGGAIRVGELISEDKPITHVLKVNLFGKKNLYYDNVTKGFRWPAQRADGYAFNNYGTQRTLPVNKELRMGALLALPPKLNLDSLNFETIPARILAMAFQDYGAYIVDDTAWDVYAIVTEWGPDGRVTEEFEKKWGFPMSIASKDTPWGRDMDKIFLNLQIVINNGPESIGGGGEPRVPLVPELVAP